MSDIVWLSPYNHSFPPAENALEDPNGLLAAGGDLSEKRLLAAYQQGIFPWYEEGQPILWWCPNPRAVIFPAQVKISRSLKKTLKKQLFYITFDQAFDQVIHACASPRANSRGTWITDEIIQAYISLHKKGHAHSVEAWQQGQLVGGLYGISMGRIFFGESMFSHVSDASKVAFVHLCRQLQQWQFPIIDCQVPNDHLRNLGAVEIPLAEFRQYLTENTALEGPKEWKFGQISWGQT